MDQKNRLAVFQELMLCCHDLFYWCYDEKLRLISSNCNEEEVLRQLFDVSKHDDVILSYAKLHNKPVVLTNEFNILCIILPEWENGVPFRFHVLGPFFMDDTAINQVEEATKRYELKSEVHKKVMEIISTLPIISLSRVIEYSDMLHFCVTGKKISSSDIHYRKNSLDDNFPEQEKPINEAHGTYEMEQQMVRMVREGNLNYKEYMDKLAVTGKMGNMSGDENSLRNVKNGILVCITLFSRAAIDGGLNPETALTLTDHYFQSVEACTSIPELGDISHSMQEDFVRRVHRCKTATIAKSIVDCCDYIDLHLDDELTLAKIAKQLNYSESYLSRKFKHETGVAVKEYIIQKRLERAKALLLTSSASVQDISEKLRFCSQSYFAAAFKKAFGVTPTSWRESPTALTHH